MPNIKDFDFIYRSLKKFSDKVIEVKPKQCLDFLEFITSSKTSTGTAAAANPSIFMEYVKTYTRKVLDG
jgi:hypothetical protein